MPSQRRTYFVRIGFVALLVVSAAQVTWWLYDQWRYTDLVVARGEASERAAVRAAEALVQQGVPAARIAELIPGATVGPHGEVRADPGPLAALKRERDRRLNRYAWEGGFFLVVLIAGISILARAVRDEAVLRRRQSNFLAAVSHELRSPLATSRVAAETLELRDPPAPERARLVGRLIRNLSRLERLVTNLLDAARLEEGSVALHAEPVALSDALAGVLAELRDRAELQVELAVDLDDAPRLAADPEAVRTVARNLLENAFTAVAEVDRPRVTVRARGERGRVVLEVQDNGRGFPPREAERLFEKFYRPGDEMRRGGRGAGLGLYLVRELLRRQGGDVEGTSSGPGTGARFRASWPAAEER